MAWDESVGLSKGRASPLFSGLNGDSDLPKSPPYNRGRTFPFVRRSTLPRPPIDIGVMVVQEY